MTLRALISHTTSLLPSTLCWMSIRHFQFEVYRPDTGLGVTHLQLKWNIRILINNSLISPRFVLPALVNWSTINTQVDRVPFLTPDISYWVAVYRSLAHTTIYWVFVIFGDWCHDCATVMHLVIRVFVIITDVLFRLSIQVIFQFISHFNLYDLKHIAFLIIKHIMCILCLVLKVCEISFLNNVVIHLSLLLANNVWRMDMFTWWRHQMETLSALLAICAGNSPVPGKFPAQRPVTRSFDVFFDLLRRNKRLSKQS